jgi:hypothetical protein
MILTCHKEPSRGSEGVPQCVCLNVLAPLLPKALKRVPAAAPWRRVRLEVEQHCRQNPRRPSWSAPPACPWYPLLIVFCGQNPFMCGVLEP